MDPELKKLLQENLAVSKNNNEILRSIRHHQWLGTLTSSLFWAVVLFAPLYLYQHYVYPLLSKFSTASTTASGSHFSLPSSTVIEKLVNPPDTGQ